MNAPWFDPNAYAWIPGTTLGCLAGLWGSLLGVLAPRGKARGLLTAFTVGILAASGLLFAAAVVAFLQGQPYGVWYGLGLPGIIGTLVIGFNLPNLARALRAAEERKMKAHDLN